MQELAAAMESVAFAVGLTTAPSGVGRFQRQALRQCSDLTLTGKHTSLVPKKCKKPNPAVYVGHTTEGRGWKMAATRVTGTCFVVL